MQMADMSQRKFEAERYGAQVIDGTTVIPDVQNGGAFNQKAGVINKFLNEENITNP